MTDTCYKCGKEIKTKGENGGYGYDVKKKRWEHIICPDEVDRLLKRKTKLKVKKEEK